MIMLNKYTVTLTDGRALVVTPNLMDKVAFEVYLRNNKHLGGLGENAIRMQAFWGWSAAKREHGLDISWDQFLEGKDPSQVSGVDVSPYDDELDETEAVDGLGEGILADLPTR